MKLISLNTWGGAAGLEGLLKFLKKHDATDVFCFQEVWNGGESMRGKTAGGSSLDRFVSDLYPQIKNALDNHVGYFRPHFQNWYGLAAFVNKNISVKEEGERFVYKDPGFISDLNSGDHARNIQFLTIETAKGLRTIINIHGLWTGSGKGDTPDRLLQSENIIKFLKKLNNPYVICGDFNLAPDTKSLTMLEDHGMRNLIKEFGITSTRSSHYQKPIRFADYALVSEDIKVNNFQVLPDEISDHLAMYLDFE